MYTYEKHTPIDGDYWIIRKDGLLFAKTFSAHDTRRIVALGNACEGIPVEVLSAPDYSIKAELDTLDEQIARRLNAEEERNRLYALRIQNVKGLHSLRFRLAAIEQAATDVEAYIDGERVAVPDVYMERLREELIRTRNALGILPEQDAVRPKESHDAQHPGQLFDLDEIKKGSPVGQCRCLIHPVPPGLEMLSPEELADGAAVDCQRIVPPVPEEEPRQKEPKTVLEIIAAYLAEKGYDGLCSDNCGCSLADFPACERLSKDCRPAYRRKGNCKDCETQCDAYDEDDPPDCYTTEKPEEAQKS